MKHTALLVFAAALGMTVAPCIPAQNTDAGGGGAVKPITSAKPGQGKLSSVKMDIVDINAGDLGGAVTALKRQLSEQDLPPMNIIFGDGTQTLMVPELELRGVSGADALQLLCTATQCEMEPIVGGGDTPEGRVLEYVIGYHIKPKEPGPGPRSAGLYYYGSARPKPTAERPVTTEARGLFVSTGARTEPRAVPGKTAKPNEGRSNRNQAPVPVPTFDESATTDRARPIRAKQPRPVAAVDAMGDAAGGGVVEFGYAPAGRPKPVLRVYPLGRITTSVKFPEVEQTLVDILEASGQKPDDAKISLHDKTNILVVRGSEDVQQLVSDLLDSLEKNQKDNEVGEVAQAKRREAEIISEMKLIEHRYERQIQDLARSREEAAAQARDLQKQLQQLQDQVESKK